MRGRLLLSCINNICHIFYLYFSLKLTFTQMTINYFLYICISDVSSITLTWRQLALIWYLYLISVENYLYFRCEFNNFNMKMTCINQKGQNVSVNFKNQIFPRRNSPEDENILIPNFVEIKNPETEKTTNIGWSFYVRLKSR